MWKERPLAHAAEKALRDIVMLRIRCCSVCMTTKELVYKPATSLFLPTLCLRYPVTVLVRRRPECAGEEQLGDGGVGLRGREAGGSGEGRSKCLVWPMTCCCMAQIMTAPMRLLSVDLTTDFATAALTGRAPTSPPNRAKLISIRAKSTSTKIASGRMSAQSKMASKSENAHKQQIL